VLVKRFAGERAWLEFERSLDDGSRSIRDVLAAEAGLVRGTYEDVVAVLRDEIAVDQSFARFAAWCAAQGYALTIVSSGIEPIVRDRLADLGLDDLPVIANGIEPDPAGWRIVFRDDAPNGTDKATVVRAARAAGSRTIFIGDGRSDYEAAIAADLRFAKRGLSLERYLRKNGIDFIAFDSFDDVIKIAAGWPPDPAPGPHARAEGLRSIG
jgi:HAD superfamily phosphoserine phosphatase-like hydrolase